MTIIVFKRAKDARVIDISPQSFDLFCKLINRAMNTWDTAPPEIKRFADEFIDGAPLQDYASQDSSSK